VELAGRSARYVLRVYTILESAISKVYSLTKLLLADRTYGRAYVTGLRLSVCLSFVRNVHVLWLNGAS